MLRLNSIFTMRLMFFTYLAFIVLLVTSCQNNSDNNSQVTTDCVYNPSLCQGGIYQQSPGFIPYNYTNGYGNYYTNNSAYLCNCPSGTVPTYNNYGGLGCIQSNYLGGYGYAYLSLSGANNNQWVNIPQISNVQGYNSNGCYNGVVQSCLVSNPSTCTSGYTCRATTAASAIGLCVSTSSNNQMGQIFR